MKEARDVQAVRNMIYKAGAASVSLDALHLSQAALNSAQALQVLSCAEHEGDPQDPQSGG